MTRGALLGLRRELIEKVTKSLIESKIFSSNLSYPRRYFDDLILEQRAVAIQANTQTQNDSTLKGFES